MRKLALILGITGSVGKAVATTLLRRGWQVRALHRNPSVAQSLPELEGVEWLSGDAMQRDDVVAGAEGTVLIVHAVNPPKYHNWRGLALPMLKNSIAAAKLSGARILMPGTVYNYGADAAPILRENSPQTAPTRKGAVRVEMEILLQRASMYGVRSMVVRAGDFFGPGAANSWLTQGIVRDTRRISSIAYPGPPDVGHSWAYVPDLAETMVRLAESTRPMKDFEVFNFRGHWFERGIDLAETIARLAGVEARRIKAFPWWLINLAAPFVEVCREMQEMRYLWNVPMQLNNDKLRAQIGEETHTSIEAALLGTFSRQLNVQNACSNTPPSFISSLSEMG
jgi:nucleoside-diphosphate-sugar epimerase